MSTYITTIAGITSTDILTKTVASDKLVVIYKATDKINISDHIMLSEQVKAKKEYIKIANRDEMLVVIGSLLSARTKFIVLDKSIPVPVGLIEKYDISYVDAKTKKKAVKKKSVGRNNEEEVSEVESTTPKSRKKKEQSDEEASNIRKEERAKRPSKEENTYEKDNDASTKQKRTRKKKVVENVEISDEAMKAFEKNMNMPKPAKKKSSFAYELKSSDDLFEHEDAVLVSKRTGIRASDIKEKIDEEALMLLIADAIKENEKDDDLKFALKTRFSEDDFTNIWNRLRGGLKVLRKDFS